MKENVGKNDRLIRSFIGPGLITLGYFFLGGKKGKLTGISTMMAGTMITESAITKVCPVNNFFGIDTRRKKSPIRKIKDAIS